MNTAVILQGMIILLLWVGGWGLAELFVDSVAGDNIQIRFLTYTIFIILGFILLWLVDISFTENNTDE